MACFGVQVPPAEEAVRVIPMKMCRPPDLISPPGNRRGSEPRHEASGVVLQKRERSEPPLKPRGSASLFFYKERFAEIEGGSLRSRYLVPPHSPRFLLAAPCRAGVRSAHPSARFPPIPGGEIKFAGRHILPRLLGQALKPGAGRMSPLTRLNSEALR